MGRCSLGSTKAEVAGASPHTAVSPVDLTASAKLSSAVNLRGSESLFYFILENIPAPGEIGFVSTQRTAKSQVASRGEKAIDKIKTVHFDARPLGCLFPA